MRNLHAAATPDDLRWQYALKDPHRPVSFHPKQCCHNILKLCSHAVRASCLSTLLPRLEGYFADLEAHGIEHESAIYVGFPFDYEEYGKKLEAPWVSGLSQGFLLGAATVMYSTSGDSAYRNLARRVHASFLQIRRNPGQPSPWVTFVDEHGYIWFEEYPSREDPQTRILNGHIYALMGIYAYYLQEPDKASLQLLQGGVTTVRHYFDAFRRPGSINRYCLLAESEPDYMPERSLLQQEWLHRLTGDPAFEEYRLKFLSDMPYHVPAYQVLREGLGWSDPECSKPTPTTSRGGHVPALSDKLSPKTGLVAAQVIDGEAILIRLTDGTYYSMNGVGTIVWQQIEAAATLQAMVTALTRQFDVDAQRAQCDLEALATRLVEEELAVLNDPDAAVGEPPPNLEANGSRYEPPTLQIYRDMRDLLALDPPAPGMPQVDWEKPSDNT